MFHDDKSVDGALDLLKRHSGIVWGPGRFAGLLRGKSVRGLGRLLCDDVYDDWDVYYELMIGTFITSEGEGPINP